MSLDINHLQQWIGREEHVDELITATPVHALSATLDWEADPLQSQKPLPPCWHWLYFLPLQRQSLMGVDGHPQRGGFLPPVPLPRRMWAGSGLTFEAPLRVGQTVRKTSRIEDVQLKQGRTGPLIFVKVQHVLTADEQVRVREMQDIVYRDNEPRQAADPSKQARPLPSENARQAASVEFDWERVIEPDPLLLFRYSALTFNGHRIHYDRNYATEVEGYPGLVVHAPFIATLLLDLLARERPDATVREYTFRAVKPLFDIAPFRVRGRMPDSTNVNLWAETPEGEIAMQATAKLS